MKVLHTTDHLAHFPAGELHLGELVRPFECPERWDYIVAALDDAGLTDVAESRPVPMELLTRVHNADYVDFLRTAWEQWSTLGHTADMIPTCFPTRRMSADVPDDIDGRLGYFAFAAETAITAGTWDAAVAAASIAHSAQRLVAAGEPVAFALCRPPGHHAGLDYFGGYCFLNNAAIAAEGFRRDGADRVAVLDVDFHHGNGTQDIFYERGDVLFASLHGDPRAEFPYFMGYEHETGRGAGAGYTRNYPLSPGTDFGRWVEALDDALGHIAAFAPDALVVSLGVDTFAADPISSFKLTSPDFLTIGQRIASSGLPTVYCMEGGYAVEEIGTNTVNVLLGHTG